MERLSGLDASFLYIESLTQPLHVCSILELDTSTVPGGVISCPDLLPDLWRLVDDFDVALEELRECAVPAPN